MSAVLASSAAVGSAPADPVRALQHALDRAAKADPGRRFHAFVTRSIAETSCGVRGSRCAPMRALRASIG